MTRGLRPRSESPPIIRRRRGLSGYVLVGSLFLRDSLTLYPTPVAPAPLRVFYVDAAAGLDTNDGLTPATAFKSMSKVTQVARAGDLFDCWGLFNQPGTTDRLGDVTGFAGTLAQPIRVRARPGFTAELAGGGGAYPPVWVTAPMDHWWLDGVQVNGTAYGVYGVETVAGATNLTVTGCILNNAAVRLLGSPDSRVYESSFIGVVGVAVNNNGDFVFMQNGSHRCQVIRNSLTGDAWHSAITISYQGAAEAGCDDVVIWDNLVDNDAAAGIIINGKALRPSVQLNDIRNAARQNNPNVASKLGLEIESQDGLYRFNRIWRPMLQGISVQSRTFAGFVQPGSGNRVQHNTVFDAPDAPLEMVLRDAGTMRDNIIENNACWKSGKLNGGLRYEVWVDCFNANVGNPDIWTGADARGNIIRYNRAAFAAPGDAGWVLVVRTAGAGGNISRTIAEAEANWPGWESNQESDPKFVSEVTPDFALQPTSPCINAGRVLEDFVPGVDYVGSAPDQGALEYVP